MKTQIIEHLGQADILLPSLIGEGLAANDRIKVRLSALQAAAHRAREPDRPATDLQAECRAAGIAPAALATLIGGAHLAGDGRIAAPNLARLMKEIQDDAATMVHAVGAGKASEGETMAARLAAIRSAGLLEAANEIEIARIASLTGMAEGGADSLHRLVMDLHKALNRLAADCAEEIVAGAHVLRPAGEDRAPVEAFMRGLNATRALKFDHPGLDTMATRSAAGCSFRTTSATTDAHVVVIAVEPNSVTVTYTDVHRGRAKFFIGAVRRIPGEMERARPPESRPGWARTTSSFWSPADYQADSDARRDAFLERARRVAGIPDRLEQGAQAAAHLGRQGRMRRASSIGRPATDRPSRLSRTRRRESGGAAVRTRRAGADRLRRAAGSGAGARRRDRFPQSRAAGLDGGACATAVRSGWYATASRPNSCAIWIVSTARCWPSCCARSGLAHDIAAAIAQPSPRCAPTGRSTASSSPARAGQIEEKADRIARRRPRRSSRASTPVATIEQLVEPHRGQRRRTGAGGLPRFAAAGRHRAALLSPLAELCAARRLTATEAAASGHRRGRRSPGRAARRFRRRAGRRRSA